MTQSAATDAVIAEIASTMLGSSSSDPDYRQHDGLYLFLSLDLVNSTEYKTREPRRWPYVIRTFYDECIREVSKYLVGDTSGPRVWKYVGDEVLFYKRLQNVSDARSCVHGAFRALESIRNSIERLTGDHELALSVKGACWTAMVQYQPPGEIDRVLDWAEEPNKPEEPMNIMFSTKMRGAPAPDFLGPDIDAGFRLSHSGACKRVLAVGADLAWILAQNEPHPTVNAMRVVDVLDLKGVWRGRFYPIVWYLDDWSKIEERFEYDDSHRIPLLGKAIHALQSNKGSLIEQLGRIIKSAERGAVYDLSMAELKRDRPSDDGSGEVLAAPAQGTEVHCVAVCVNSSGKVLIARRPKDKPVYPDKWEFGCAQMRPGDCFTSAMTRDYKADFGVDLRFADNNPRPIDTYSFMRDGSVVSGIVFVAEADGEVNIHHQKHTEYKWIDPGDMSADLPEESVPRLREHAMSAIGACRRGAKKADQLVKAKSVPKSSASRKLVKDTTPPAVADGGAIGEKNAG